MYNKNIDPARRLLMRVMGMESEGIQVRRGICHLLFGPGF